MAVTSLRGEHLPNAELDVAKLDVGPLCNLGFIRSTITGYAQAAFHGGH